MKQMANEIPQISAENQPKNPTLKSYLHSRCNSAVSRKAKQENQLDRKCHSSQHGGAWHLYL